MSEIQQLQRRVDELEREIKTLREKRMDTLNVHDVEKVKDYIFKGFSPGLIGEGFTTEFIIFEYKGVRRVLLAYRPFREPGWQE